MGGYYSSDCCDWSEENEAIYLSGNYKVINKNKISYYLSQRQKREMKYFFETNYECVTDFRHGLIVHIPEGLSIPGKWEKVMLKFIIIQNMAFFYLREIRVDEEIRKS